MRSTAAWARALPALAIAGLLSACDAEEGRTDQEAASPPGPSGGVRAPAFEVVADGLEVPWDLAFAPDGRIFATERGGRIRVVVGEGTLPQPWAVLDVEAVGEAGLTAIALSPDFDATGHVFVLGTFRAAEGLENRVVRVTDRQGSGVDPRVVVGGLPADRLHAGGALEFGPDGMLYVATGDAGAPDLVQSRETLHGKVLRYRPDGSPAPGNPFGGPVHALGLRNVQGLDWHPSGDLFASEHGPSGLPWEGGRTGDDELNRIEAGGNYGWPEVAGWGGGERFTDPVVVWDPAIAPSGLAIYTGDDFPDWRGHAFLGGLRGRQLRRVGLARVGGGWTVTDQEALFEDELGRIRGVKMAPDGRLYFTTSNRDGRGSPAASDDRILRVVPR